MANVFFSGSRTGLSAGVVRSVRGAVVSVFVAGMPQRMGVLMDVQKSGRVLFEPSVSELKEVIAGAIQEIIVVRDIDILPSLKEGDSWLCSQDRYSVAISRRFLLPTACAIRST
ncbi:MAG: hypothetical protein ACLFRC_01405, partial [Desulfonatronovibrionaceae bacterium]